MYQELSLLSDYKQELHSWNGAPPRIGDVLVLILIVHNYCIFTGPTVVLIYTSKSCIAALEWCTAKNWCCVVGLGLCLCGGGRV